MPFDWGTTPKIVINDSLIFYMSYHNNYGHLMGETAPLMHSLLCTYFGRWAWRAWVVGMCEAGRRM